MLLEFRGVSDSDIRSSGENTSMALHQSWVMSSRTKTILNAVSPSSSKALATQDAAEMRKTEHQQMESVAVYMYTLVQCYKIDERLRCVHTHTHTHSLCISQHILHTHPVAMSMRIDTAHH